MDTAKIIKRIEELEELLECHGKLSDTDKVLIELEIEELNAKISNRRIQKRKREPKIMDKHRNMKRDKAKHGCSHWSKSKRKKYLIKQANNIVRHSHLFSHKGRGFKKCFDVAWELD